MPPLLAPGRRPARPRYPARGTGIFRRCGGPVAQVDRCGGVVFADPVSMSVIEPLAICNRWFTSGHLMVDCNQFGGELNLAEQARSGCPINTAVEAFGDSWTLLVLRDVMFRNLRHFRELLAGSEEGIASNILADRLKRLVSAGLMTREDVGSGRRAAYSLTEASIQLVPVMAQLAEWGLGYRPTSKRMRVRAELLAAGGPELWTEFMAELRAIHLGEPAPERNGPSVMERLAQAYAAAS